LCALKINLTDYLGLVKSRALKYRPFYPFCDLDDLISLGFLGLAKARRKFRRRFNVKFSTYSVWWIDDSIRVGAMKFEPEIRKIFRIIPAGHYKSMEGDSDDKRA